MPKIPVTTKVTHVRDPKKTNRYKLRKINEVSDELYEKSEILNQSTFDMINSRQRLQNCLDAIRKKEDELSKQLNGVQKINDELKNMAEVIEKSNFKDHTYTSQININAALAMQDSIVAQKQIYQIKHELDFQSPIVPGSRNAGFQAYRSYDQVVIPKKPLEKMAVTTSEKNLGKCVICLENPVNQIVIPCGHACLCETCAQMLMRSQFKETCPICRNGIVKIIAPKLL